MSDVSQKQLTGRHVLAITIGAFAIILGANLAMLFAAVGSFPGLEVKNSYVASQSFDRERAAQEALGWTVSAAIEEDWVVVRITDATGAPVHPDRITATIGRTTHQKEDRVLAFARDGAGFSAPARLDPGHWHIRLSAGTADGDSFRQRIPVFVSARK